MKRFICAALAVLSLTSVSHADPLGPMPYQSFFDSPLLNGLFSNRVHLETFEDGLFNTLHVTQTGAQSITTPGDVFTDSVDADDFSIDGSGTNGRSHYTADGATGITYTFSPVFQDRLPTMAGIVWTDLSGTADVFFEAFDENGSSLGTINAGPLNDGFSTGQTAEDRFLGWQNTGGISRIHIYQSGSDMEVDHLQFGIQSPEPTTAGLALLGFAMCWSSRRVSR